MTQEPHKSNIVLILIAVIGVIGTIIGATITVIGNYNVEKLHQETELTRIALISIATQGGATQMVLQNTANAPTEPPAPTYTPYPTFTLYPTLKVEPTVFPTVDTRPTDTPPGTVLQIGETWTTLGFSVQLRSLTFAFGDEADLQFTFTNNTGRTLFFHLSKDNHIIVKDNLGKVYTWATPYEDDLILENGASQNIPVYKGGNFSGIQYLIITVDLPSLIYAQWKN
jgi:hypothetical protein